MTASRQENTCSTMEDRTECLKTCSRSEATSVTLEFLSAFVYMVIALAVAIKIFNSERAMVRY
jgi:hypothetical protein